MCCFTGTVRSVSQTRIFARSLADGQQSVAYAMSLDAERELAMILPVPSAPGTAADGMSFHDLSGYADFFDDLHHAWPVPRSLSAGVAPTPAPATSKLAVVQVGSFEASFVPTVADFARLDERFRLPAGTWDQLPQYRAYGFAVFKLKPGRHHIHPMAFSFPRADSRALFFPTMHIHDGAIHLKADFDHQLYCQKLQGEALALHGWEESQYLLGHRVDAEKAKDLIDPNAHGYRLVLHGQLDNRDTVLRPA